MHTPFDLQFLQLTAADQEQTPEKQQAFLRAVAKTLRLTQKALALRMEAPWSTFEKWLLPINSKNAHAMPDIAWALAREILAHEQLKTQVGLRKARR